MVSRPMNTPWERYQHDIQQLVFAHDEAQALAVRELQRLYDELLAYRKTQHGLLAKVKRWFGKEPQAAKGIYFWGGVGRGKTYLVDTFFESLPIDEKMRVHFHR